MSKTYWRRQNLVQNKTDVHNLEKILRIAFWLSWCFQLGFFRYLRLRKIFNCSKGFPSISWFFATKWILINFKGFPLYIFWPLWDCPKFSFFVSKSINVCKGSCLHFFKKPKGSLPSFMFFGIVRFCKMIFFRFRLWWTSTLYPNFVLRPFFATVRLFPNLFYRSPLDFY